MVVVAEVAEAPGSFAGGVAELGNQLEPVDLGTAQESEALEAAAAVAVAAAVHLDNPCTEPATGARRSPSAEESVAAAGHIEVGRSRRCCTCCTEISGWRTGGWEPGVWLWKVEV